MITSSPAAGPGPPDSRAAGRRPLRRSRRHRIVAGVCGGLAEWLGWRPLVVRVFFVLIGALPFLSGILAYAVLWLLIPEDGGPPAREPREPTVS